jgi:hypothetical protein
MPPSKAIADFQVACQRHFTCFSCGLLGLQALAEKLVATGAQKERTLYIGSGHPDEGNTHSAIKIGDFLAHSQPDAFFTDQISKAFLVIIYSEWEEFYRPQLAAEIGLGAKSAVKCRLMGDVRTIRNCIVHNRSVISEEDRQKIRVLGWKLTLGELSISKAMFCELINQINIMQVFVEQTDE